MTGFTLEADSYRKAAEQGKLGKEEAEQFCRIYDFLGACSEDDFYKLFDSSAFNEIVMCYVRRAVRELVDEEVLDDEQARRVRNRVSLLFDEMQAKEVCEG